MIGCQLCDPEWNELDKNLISRNLFPEMKVMLNDIFVEYKCPRCNSRSRNRTLYKMIDFMQDFFTHKPRKVLLVSSPMPERRIATKYVDDYMHISLHGNFDDKNCIEGINIMNLSNVESQSIDFSMACCVLDYIPDLRAVFLEQKRVLKNGGRFLFLIMPYRLVEKETAPRVKHNNALSHESYAQNGAAETGIPDCEFSVDWILDQARGAGLDIMQMFMIDDLSRLQDRWFLAQNVDK